MGYDVLPKYDDLRSDIIQVVKLNNAEEVISFCQGVQAAAPVDAFQGGLTFDHSKMGTLKAIQAIKKMKEENK